MPIDPQAREAILFLAAAADAQADRGSKPGYELRVRAILADAQPQTPESDWRSGCEVRRMPKFGDGNFGIASPTRAWFWNKNDWLPFSSYFVPIYVTESDARAALAKAPPPPDVDQPKSPTSPHPSTTTLPTRGTGEPEKPKPETIDLKRRPWPVVIAGALASVRVIIDDGSPCGEAIACLRSAEEYLVEALNYTRDPKTHTSPPRRSAATARGRGHRG